MNYYDIKLVEELMSDEGVKNYSYLDTTGNWTIGVGHKLGKSSSFSNIKWDNKRVFVTLLEDINSSIFYLQKQIPVLQGLTQERQHVLINMMFNLGPNRFAGFKETIKAINNYDYRTAYNEMLDSKWAREDVPNRAKRLANRWLMG